MSWLTDLAGKAEDFLNKVDQGAASALSKQQGPSACADECAPQQAVDSRVHSSTAAPLLTHAAQQDSASLKTSAHFVRPKKSQPDDDLLFDFLNSTDANTRRRSESRREPCKKQGQAAETPVLLPSTPSTAAGGLSPVSTSVVSGKTAEDESAKDQSQGALRACDNRLLQSQEEPECVEEPQGPVTSSLSLENQLLRTEVTSLNQEIATLVQRVKDQQEELTRAHARCQKVNTHQSHTDRTIRELRSQLDDLTEVISAKDGQLAVLKVRLDEADQLLLSHNKTLEAAQAERSRILQDHTEGGKMHLKAVETLQERLRDTEATLRRQQESYRTMQSELSERLAKAEGERHVLAEAVTASERRTAEQSRKADDIMQQLKSARNAAETAKQELQDYKHKASRILQSKEKLINSLKEGSGLELTEGAAGSLELEELRHEKELQRDEIHKLQGQLQSLQVEMQELDRQALAEAELWRDQQRELQQQHLLQDQARKELEAELERCKQELQYIDEEHRSTKSTLQSRIKDREEEIQKLRNQLTNKTLSNSSQAELENRLHQLTETLIQKQTMLEALGTEKNSLAFQLERLEGQMKSLQGGQASGQAVNMGPMEGLSSRMRSVPVLFSDHEAPASGMYSKVQKAASTIDKFSIRLGIFLRRYPVARVFVIVYMALLHLWVMVVLLTYTPEMHPSGQPGGR